MATEAGAIGVEIVRAWPADCESHRLRLSAGATVAEALARAADAGFAAAAQASPDALAIFGKLASPSTRLHDGDRIELLRPLLADPKERRRERAGRRSG